MTPERLLHELALVPSSRDLTNFYRDDLPGGVERRQALLTFLSRGWSAPTVLVAEAPGYRGARLSGVPLTSQHQLQGQGRREATSTVVHRTLEQLGHSEVLLWNVVPFHPHQPGMPHTNRRPTPAECSLSRPFLEAITAGRCVIAVGNLAARHLPGHPSVRHPANGGAVEFARGLALLLG